MSKVQLADDEVIRQKFQSLDHEYNYFSNDKKAEDNFVDLFKACKLVADFVEKNNSEDNDVAYLHAYKMLVLFGAGKQNPFSQVENFIKTHGSKFEKPVHDILVHAIPKNDPPITLLDWQKMLAKTGCKAIELFQEAPDIEKVLERAPKDLVETEAAAAKLTYARASQHPELAKLCKQYHVAEEIFNKCLDVKPKQSDKLPDVIIDGATVNQKSYYLVKLPIAEGFPYGDSKKTGINFYKSEKSSSISRKN